MFVRSKNTAGAGPARRVRTIRREPRGENLLMPAVAVVVAGVLYALLPESLLLGPRLLIPALEAALLVAVVATNPRRLTREHASPAWPP